MKINKLDLAKVISDFMFLGINEPKEKARIVFKVKHKLTAHWFEKYMQYYFEKIKGYQVTLNGKTNEFDGGIDLKWIKIENWKKKYLVVQCKKYSVRDINEDQVASYHSKSLIKYSKYVNDVESYFITTSKFTYKATELCKSAWINAIDFTHIYKLQNIYSIEQFEFDLKEKEWIKEVTNSFERDQLLLELDKQTYEAIWVTNKDVFELLRQVRRDYSHEKQLRLWDIAKNETLELLARKRPHNFEALKRTISKLPTRERNKIIQHGDIFLERLKYIHEDNQIEQKQEKWFIKSLIEFIK